MLQKMKELGVQVVVLPPLLTNVIQPLDKSVFRALNSIFPKIEATFKKLNPHRAPAHADFSLWTAASVEDVTPKNIVASFRVCGIVPFSPFLAHCRKERLVEPQDQPVPSGPLGGECSAEGLRAATAASFVL